MALTSETLPFKTIWMESQSKRRFRMWTDCAASLYNPWSPEGGRYGPKAGFLAKTTKRKGIKKMVTTCSSRVQFRMFRRSPLEDSSFQYLERLGKAGAPPRKNRTFSAGRCNFSFQQHTDIIPTATSTFSTTANWNMTKSMSPNVVDYRVKPEPEITFEL